MFLALLSEKFASTFYMPIRGKLFLEEANEAGSGDPSESDTNPDSNLNFTSGLAPNLNDDYFSQNYDFILSGWEPYESYDSQNFSDWNEVNSFSGV